LRARAQEDVLLEDQDEQESRYFEPDIAIVEIDSEDEAVNSGSVAVATQPVVVTFVPQAKRRRWVEILDTADSNRVVTAIEILSPGNKESGKLNQKYREKLDQYLDAGANIVEIDLLRSSRKRLVVTSDRIPTRRRAAYYVAICRARKPNRWMIYPMPLRDPLPTIPIPCRAKDDDVPLELQPIIDRIYLEGGHDDLKYNQPPEPPFSKEDAKWAAGLIGKRRSAK
jgi:hypothetical protein